MFFWLPSDDGPDVHAAFRSVFFLPTGIAGRLRLSGSAAFRVSLDGRPLAVGPCRFVEAEPEYEELLVELEAGEHVLAIQAHYYGVETRLWPLLPPFLFCQLRCEDGGLFSLSWQGSRLEGFEKEVRRVNPQLGWIEWCDTSKNPAGWTESSFDGKAWPAAEEVEPPLRKFSRADLAPLNFVIHSPAAIESGCLAETFGYERDDIPARFFLRDLSANVSALPVEGLWRRYDLGRIRLATPRFVLDLPAGAVVEIAASESLTHGKVAPYIPLSVGSSCNLDHYVARGGRQEFCPVSPRGGRFWEIHVRAAPEQIHFLREEFEEKAYFGEAAGCLESSDSLIDRIWETGVETFRACCEDALTDNPTRERGQWLGDAATVGLEIAAVAFTDLRPIRRSLLQSALCAREDGLIAGLTPGGAGYLASYAHLWVEGCWRYFQQTGDRSFLEKMLPYARRNLEAFLPSMGPHGLSDSLKGGDAWVFIDWAYERAEGAIDPAYNLYFLRALRALRHWSALFEEKDLSEKCRDLEELVCAALLDWLEARLETGSWEAVGWHVGGLLAGAGILDESASACCIDFLKKHFQECFPNRKEAPRLSAPHVRARELISPFFCHFVFPALVEAGEIDFVLQQIRSCWGWALGDDRTTWLEVFDTRWSHCHQWSGCPTWILSRYLLGLHPRGDLGPGHCELRMALPASVERVSGILPLHGPGGKATIAWERAGGRVHFSLHADRPLTLHVPDQEGAEEVAGPWEATFDEKVLRF